MLSSCLMGKPGNYFSQHPLPDEFQILLTTTVLAWDLKGDEKEKPHMAPVRIGWMYRFQQLSVCVGSQTFACESPTSTLEADHSQQFPVVPETSCLVKLVSKLESLWLSLTFSPLALPGVLYAISCLYCIPFLPEIPRMVSVFPLLIPII